MLNLGNLNVKDLFLGSTKVSSAWLGTQKVWPVGSAAPYDYRVEWIETDGIASYIDTGVDVDFTPTTTTKVSMTFKYATMPSGSRGPCVCGARYGTTGVQTAFAITIMDTSTNKRIITFHPSTVSISPITPIDTDIHTIEMGFPNVLFDGIQVTATDTPSVSYNPRFMIGCGGDPALWSFDNTLYHPANVKVYHCKIINGGNVVFDAFPVVKDGKAGLYDRVSGKVLFNANTAGTITAGPQVPFDYEVEWIQRDYSIPWTEGGTSVVGGFDISQYLQPGYPYNSPPKYSLTWSFEPVSNAVVHAFLLYTTGIFTNLNLWKGNNRTVYQFSSLTRDVTTIQGDLNVFHRQNLIPIESGSAQLLMDGTVFNTKTMSSTNLLRNARILSLTVPSNLYSIRARVKQMTFSNSVYLIPVVKDDKMGFYNRVDGKVFLEKQPCLSAGPAIK